MSDRRCGNCRQWQPNIIGSLYGVCQFPRPQPLAAIPAPPIPTGASMGATCPVFDTVVILSKPPKAEP